MKSIFICGYCGKDTRKETKPSSIPDIEKVILGGYANMLCSSCKMQLEDSIEDIAKRYLNKK